MRDIKEVLRGYIPSGEVREWDVTPDVVVDQLTFQDEGTVNGTFSDGKLIVNGTTDPSTIHLGVMKTNVGMSLLSDGDAYRFSIRLSDVLVDSLLMFGLAIYPETMTPAQVRNEIITGLTDGLNSRPSPIFLSVLLRYSSFSNAIIYAKLNTDTQPNGQLFNAISTQSDTMDLDVGTVEHLFLRKTPTALYVSKELVSSDGVTYDIYGLPEIADGVVFADNLRVYVFAGSIIAGGGMPTVHGRYSVEPTFDIVPVSRTVTGTTFANAVGNQTIFDSYFPNIKKPETITVTQKTFPIGARPLELYKTKVVGNVSVPIEPYGITTSNNQLVLINNTQLGNESFTPFIDSNLLGDYLRPIEQQQADLVQSIADMGILIQQSANDVNKALINAGEMVVFVKQSTGPDPDLDSNITFSSFDDAYAYLTTFPTFIKKRIVLDDRGGAAVIYGSDNTTYRIGFNNITLSTFNAFNQNRLILNPQIGNSGSLNLALRGIYTSLRLQHFEGRLEVGSKIEKELTLPKTLEINDSFFAVSIHDFTPETVGLALLITVQEHSCLVISVNLELAPSEHPVLRIDADDTSPVDFSSYQVNPVLAGMGYAGIVQLYRTSVVRSDIIPSELANLAYVTRNIVSASDRLFGKDDAFLWYMNIVNAGIGIVRCVDDFGTRNENISSAVATNNITRFIVVGDVDFGSHRVRLFTDVEIIGFAGSKIRGTETLFELVNSDNKLKISNCELKQESFAPSAALINVVDTNGNGGPQIQLKDSVIDARKPIDFYAPVNRGASLTILDIQRCKFLNFVHPIVYTGCNRLIARDLEFELIGSPSAGLFVVDIKQFNVGYKNFIDIDKIDILTVSADAQGNAPVTLKLNTGTYTPNSLGVPFIFLNNINTIPTGSSQYWNEILVYLNNENYDYLSDTNFETESIGTYALVQGNITYNIGTSGQSHIGSITTTDTQLRAFQVNSFGLSYLGFKQKQFLVRVEITVSGIPTSNISILLKRRITNSISGFVIDNPVLLDSEQLLNLQGQTRSFIFNRVVTMSNLHSLVLEAVNNINSDDIGVETKWSVTEV